MGKMIINGQEYVPVSKVQALAPQKDGLTYCIIRTYSAGVWAGYVDYANESMCQEVFEARRLWRWWSEFTLSALAMQGYREDKKDENKYAMPVPSVRLFQIIELIPCTMEAQERIQSLPNYKE